MQRVSYLFLGDSSFCMCQELASSLCNLPSVGEEAEPGQSQGRRLLPIVRRRQSLFFLFGSVYQALRTVVVTYYLCRMSRVQGSRSLVAIPAVVECLKTQTAPCKLLITLVV